MSGVWELMARSKKTHEFVFHNLPFQKRMYV